MGAGDQKISCRIGDVSAPGHSAVLHVRVNGLKSRKRKRRRGLGNSSDQSTPPLVRITRPWVGTDAGTLFEPPGQKPPGTGLKERVHAGTLVVAARRCQDERGEGRIGDHRLRSEHL